MLLKIPPIFFLRVVNDELKKSIPTPTLSSNPPKPHLDHSYENTNPQQQSTPEKRPQNTKDSIPRKTIGETSGNYNVVPQSLPAFLRNDEMLSVPVVSDDVVKTAQKDFDESYARLSMIVVDKDGGDYMDPQDARNKTVTTKTHEKLDQRVSRSKQTSEANVGSMLPFTVANREDYSEVSDTLMNESTIVNLSNSTSSTFRPRTISDTSPVKKVAHDQVRKTFSMKHRPNNVANAKSQPLKRKSSAKEVVTFDPKGGFKLTAKRSSSDGVPQSSILPDPQTSSSDPQTPESNENKNLPSPSRDVGGKHMYAAVDLTAKCRPETDMVRREGVGTPDHYIACV